MSMTQTPSPANSPIEDRHPVPQRPVKPGHPSHLVAVVLLATALAAGAGAAEIHRWTDGEGNVHFGDRPPTGVDSQIVRPRVNTYTSPSVEGLEAIFAPDERVVMYSASWCGVCKRARRYFQDRRIAFTEYDIETSAAGRRGYRKLGARGVPVILVGGQRLNGFDAATFERLYHRTHPTAGPH